MSSVCVLFVITVRTENKLHKARPSQTEGVLSVGVYCDVCCMCLPVCLTACVCVCVCVVCGGLGACRWGCGSCVWLGVCVCVCVCVLWCVFVCVCVCVFV